MQPAPQTAFPVEAAVCNYNGREYLEDCLTALLGQSCPPTRVVVYDNASTDDSVAWLAERFPEVPVVCMERNDGPCPARNRALQEASTEWVLQIDSDVILEPRCLERLQQAVRQDPSVTVYMPRAVFDQEPDRIHYDGGSFHYVGVLSLDHFFAPVPSEPEAPVDVDAVIAMALLMRADVVRQVGGYHPDYFILFEDYDLSYRLRAQGHRLVRVPDALARHREGTAGISYREGPRYPERRAFLHSRNRWMLLIRNHSLRALVLGLPGILLYEAVWLCFAVGQGNLGAWWRGKRDLWRKLPDLRRQRRKIQSARRVGDRQLLRCVPLTHAPMVKQGALRRGFEALLDRLLNAWWWMMRWGLS